MNINFINNEFLQRKKDIEGEENIQVIDFDTIEVKSSPEYTYLMSIDKDGRVIATQDEFERTEFIYRKDTKDRIQSIRKFYNDGTWKILDINIDGRVKRSRTRDGIIWED